MSNIRVGVRVAIRVRVTNGLNSLNLMPSGLDRDGIPKFYVDGTPVIKAWDPNLNPDLNLDRNPNPHAYLNPLTSTPQTLHSQTQNSRFL